jgi:hypothetical protein
MAMADEGGAVERPEEAARLLAVVLSMILDAGCVEVRWRATLGQTGFHRNAHEAHL